MLPLIAGAGLLIAAGAAPACAQAPPDRAAGRAIETPALEALGELPATFKGDLPCADCRGIRHQLDLCPDGSFYLRTTYFGRGPDNAFDDIGGLTVCFDGRTLALKGGRAAPQMFAIESATTLRKLEHLELYDSGGALLARLERRLMP